MSFTETTLPAALRAAHASNETGATTVAAVTLVDRSGLAGPQFEQRGISYYPMTTYESLGIEPVTPAATTAAS